MKVKTLIRSMMGVALSAVLWVSAPAYAEKTGCSLSELTDIANSQGLNKAKEAAAQCWANDYDKAKASVDTLVDNAVSKIKNEPSKADCEPANILDVTRKEGMEKGQALSQACLDKGYRQLKEKAQQIQEELKPEPTAEECTASHIKSIADNESLSKASELTKACLKKGYRSTKEDVASGYEALKKKYFE